MEKPDMKKNAVIIYENMGKYIADEAIIGETTMAVSLWKRRALNSFIWGVASKELAKEAQEINKEFEALQKKRKAFHAKLEDSRKVL